VWVVFGGLLLLLPGVRLGGAAYVESGCVLRLPAFFLYYGLLFVVVGWLVWLWWFLWSCAVWRGLWVFLGAPLRVPPLVGAVGCV
jgi:hypothetical protein